MTSMKIDPASVAFDIDGVFADTMTLFLDIARDEYNVNGIKYEDITCYQLEECIDIDAGVIKAILSRIMDGDYTALLKPITGAPDVLTRLGRQHSPILFVTARPYLGPIYDWVKSVLPLDPGSIEVIATGSFEAKADVLADRDISYFVEDRLETCFPLQAAGLVPVLFKQPWNRKLHPFTEVSTWQELESLIEFK
uniref:Haloacid dehalogenase n=1 Tax=Candidatus Desulfatibia profunda TaxID=2841695 RepID=A0A8J6NLE7_9BACT|nr:haloacid dehalogenase [Candidatus Desulfatibia profunda]